LLKDRGFGSRKSWKLGKESGESLGYGDAAQGERVTPKRVALWLRILSIVLLATVSTPLAVLAEGLRIQTDLEYQTTTFDSKNTETGETIEGDFSRFSQLYDVDLQKELYPYLELNAGGLFDLQTTRLDADGSDSENEQMTAEYFAGLQLNNPQHRAGFTYRNSQVRTEATDLVTSSIFREQYIARWNWRPADLPSFNLDYNRTHAFDEPETRDLINDFLTLRSRYEYREVSLDYTYTRNDKEETLAESGTLSQIHNGRIRYSTRLFGDRVSLTAGSRLNYSTLEPSGEGDVRRSTSSLGSPLFWPFNSDESSQLDPEGVDINLDRPPSVGLDFGSPTEVDTLYLLPLESDDRSLGLASPEQIQTANRYFSWEVFISDDGENWEEHRSSFQAEYSAFDNRFELSFPRVTTRFIQVRVTPPSGPNEVPGKILISQVQGFTTIDASSGETLEDHDQNHNLGLRWAITDRTSTTYDVYYNLLTSEPSETKKWMLGNSVGLRHMFSPIFVGNVRVFRSDEHLTGRDDRTHHSYVASIRGDYLETFNQTLIYSGTHTDDEEGSSSGNSIFLRHSADLYEDWSANLDLGQSWRNPSEAAKTRSTIIRARTNLIPNRKIRLRVDYSFAWVDEEGEGSRIEQNGRAEVYLVPFRTLSLFAAVSFRDRDDEGGGVDVTQDYSVNWGPFPDGSLNFSFGYNYFKQTEGLEERFFSPRLTWEIARGVLLTLEYTMGTVKSGTQKSDRKIFDANLRVYY
jgi:hypothetical protein